MVAASPGQGAAHSRRESSESCQVVFQDKEAKQPVSEPAEKMLQNAGCGLEFASLQAPVLLLLLVPIKTALV